MKDDPAKIDDGGPAFPLGGDGDNRITNHGMSLRDWFAGQALCGYIAGVVTIPEGSKGIQRLNKLRLDMGLTSAQFAANNAYIYADAMLAARKGGAD